MKDKRTGLVATLAVVLTFFGVSNLSRKGTEAPPASESRKIPGKKAEQKNAGATEILACYEIASRLQRFALELKLPQSCYAKDAVPPATPAATRLRSDVKLDYAIAFVPNPVTTHLALFFDRSVEIIQQAEQDELYSYDSSWFPWDDTAKDYPLLSDQLEADGLKQIREQHPGVMVFRRSPGPGRQPYDAGLIIFLVGEQPTRGITDTQFQNAISWIRALAGDKTSQTLNILGPTFSGSLPSLALQLDGKLAPYFSGVKVNSGSVSSGTAIEWFQKFLHDKNLGTFRTFVESDSVMVNRFCTYLSQRGYPENQIAILSEDETAFGQANPEKPEGSAANDSDSTQAVAGRPSNWRQKDDPRVYLYYPRDIASLRSAYEQQSIFSSAKQTATQNAPSTTLRGDLSEPESSEHDTVRSYSGQLTPLAQESVLFAIVRILREKHIQFVIVRSSSTLDQIFLSQFLRKSFPEGRVVLDGADLLFRKDIDGVSLRGVMILSSYPLISQEQDWTRPQQGRSRAYRIFGEDVIEGIYIAARMLWSSDGDAGREDWIRDYAAPMWAQTAQDNQNENWQPSTWISVIGHRQFWPLAALNGNTLSQSGQRQVSPGECCAPQNAPEPGVGSGVLDRVANQSLCPVRISYLPFDMKALLLACLLWSGWHLYCCWFASMKGSPGVVVYFAPLAGYSHKLLIFGGSLLLALLAFILAAGSGVFSPDLDTRPQAILATATALIFFAAAVACIGNFELPQLHGELVECNPRKGLWRSVAGGLAVVTALLGYPYYSSLIKTLTPANRFPSYWRSIHVLSGVSGLLPQVLLIAGLYGWVWFRLHGLALTGEDRPILPSRDNLPKLKNGSSRMPMFTREEAGDEIEHAASPFTRAYAIGLLVLLAACLGVSLLGGISVRSLGEHKFGNLILFCLNLCMAMVLANTWQLLRTWSRLRQLLVFLDRMPLRRTLNALRGLSWGSVWMIGSNVMEERYRVISRQLESLNHLRNTIADAPDTQLAPAERAAILDRLDAGLDNAREFAEWYVSQKPGKCLSILYPMRKFQAELAAIAGFVMEKVLMPEWRKEKESLIFDRTPAKGDDGGRVIPTLAAPDYVWAAEEFFVLPYLGFIQNALGIIRTIVLGGLCLFIGATLSVTSYPFDPRPVLAGAFLFVFVLVGIAMTVVYAQMHRDATLSHITNTRPGELGIDFWTHIFTFGIGPLLGVLTALFPSITDFVASWLQPGTQLTK